jgi:hypothetical protein
VLGENADEVDLDDVALRSVGVVVLDHERTYARFIERKNRQIVEAKKRQDEIAGEKRQAMRRRRKRRRNASQLEKKRRSVSFYIHTST